MNSSHGYTKVKREGIRFYVSSDFKSANPLKLAKISVMDYSRTIAFLKKNLELFTFIYKVQQRIIGFRRSLL